MGGTPSFELTFFGMERSVPDCLIRLIRDLEQGIISEAEFEPYEVRGAVCYAVEPSEPEGTFAEIREIEDWTDTDPVVKRRRREGDGVIRYRYSVRFSVWGSSDYLDEFLEDLYRKPEYREAVDVLMGKRWAWEAEFRDSWGYSSARREAYSRYAGLGLAEGGEDPSGI